MFLFAYALTLPVIQVILLYAIAAFLPAILLLRYIYKQDSFEKEPGYLLWQLLLLGALAGFLSMILESVGDALINRSSLDPNSLTYQIVYYFCVVGMVEEGTKYILMASRTWRDPNFDFRFDGIVYAVFTSLGFAAMENLLYVINYGLSVAPSRALLSIPGHMAFAVLFGAFYGRAKLQHDLGHTGRQATDIIIGYVLAVCLHGTYDTCASLGDTTSTLVFIAVIVIVYILCFLVVKKEARADRRV